VIGPVLTAASIAGARRREASRIRTTLFPPFSVRLRSVTVGDGSDTGGAVAPPTIDGAHREELELSWLPSGGEELMGVAVRVRVARQPAGLAGVGV
jgi:hypothetical protein